MEFQDYFPVWEKLTSVQQQQLKGSAISRTVKKWTVLHNGNLDCTGLLLIRRGQLRSYILSDEGREITLYRLFDRDICLFSASCMMRSIQFEMMIEAEKDTELWIVPAEIYQSIMQESAPVSNFTNEIMATRFSEVIWLMEQIMWKSFDKRLAAFLLEESTLEETQVLKITHETIANHLGTAREVVTRMLRYFQSEGMVKLARGTVENWRAGVQKEEKTSLVTTGIYSISRNPAFLGFDLMYIGILFSFFNWFLCFTTGFAVVFFHLQIVNVEEDFLIEAFGNEYLQYKSKVCRYLGRKR